MAVVVLEGEQREIEVPFNADVRGTAAAETIQVTGGASVQFAAGTGDRVAFEQNLAAYDFTQAGNTLTLENESGARAEIALNADTELAFANGSATAGLEPSGGSITAQVGGQPVDESFDPTAVNLDGNDVSGVADPNAGNGQQPDDGGDQDDDTGDDGQDDGADSGNDNTDTDDGRDGPERTIDLSQRADATSYTEIDVAERSVTLTADADEPTFVNLKNFGEDARINLSGISAHRIEVLNDFNGNTFLNYVTKDGTVSSIAIADLDFQLNGFFKGGLFDQSVTAGRVSDFNVSRDADAQPIVVNGESPTDAILRSGTLESHAESTDQTVILDRLGRNGISAERVADAPVFDAGGRSATLVDTTDFNEGLDINIRNFSNDDQLVIQPKPTLSPSSPNVEVSDVNGDNILDTSIDVETNTFETNKITLLGVSGNFDTISDLNSTDGVGDIVVEERRAIDLGRRGLEQNTSPESDAGQARTFFIENGTIVTESIIRNYRPDDRLQIEAQTVNLAVEDATGSGTRDTVLRFSNNGIDTSRVVLEGIHGPWESVEQFNFRSPFSVQVREPDVSLVEGSDDFDFDRGEFGPASDVTGAGIIKDDLAIDNEGSITIQKEANFGADDLIQIVNAENADAAISFDETEGDTVVTIQTNGEVASQYRFEGIGPFNSIDAFNESTDVGKIVFLDDNPPSDDGSDSDTEMLDNGIQDTGTENPDDGDGDTGDSGGDGDIVGDIPTLPRNGGPAAITDGDGTSGNDNIDVTGLGSAGSPVTVNGGGGDDRFIVDTAVSANVTIDDFAPGDQLLADLDDRPASLSNPDPTDGAFAIEAGDARVTVTNLDPADDSIIEGFESAESLFGDTGLTTFSDLGISG